MLTLLLASLAVCAPALAGSDDKIADHELVADDGGAVASKAGVSFAVLGNTRGTVPAIDRVGGGISHGDAVAQSIVENIGATIGAPGGPAFAVHTGDMVRTGATKEWKAFDALFAPILLGDTRVDGEKPRLKSVPVAGDREFEKDPRYEGFGSAFPGVGEDIGLNRVATWYHFDLRTGDTRWRMIVLDSGKERLGSRWTEQLAWLEKAAQGDYDYALVFMHEGVLDLGGPELDMNHGGGPAELLETLEDAMGLMKVRGVISAGHHTNQVLLPDGPFGAIHVGAGGAGAPAQLLRRWGAADAANRPEDVQLDPMYDLALLDALDRWNAENELPDIVIDQAKARGSYEGFTGGFDPKHFPVHGWWQVSLNGPTATLVFHHRRPDGQFADIYKASFDPGNGWRGAKLPGWKGR